MGKIWMPGSGGPDLDPTTATAPDVLSGKVIINNEGDPVTGTMPNRGAITQTLNAGGSYTIPSGYHSGSGKVTANSLSSQTSATATTSQILSGQTAWVNGSKITGTIGSMAGQTIAPTASQQTVSSSGKYMTGNVVVNGVSNLTAANIKKGVVVGGVTGTFEGWVVTPSTLYNRGNNSANLTTGISTSNTTFESGGILVNNGYVKLDMSSPINFSGYNWLNVDLRYDGSSVLNPDAANKDWPTRNPALMIGLAVNSTSTLYGNSLHNDYIGAGLDDKYPSFVASNLLTTDSRLYGINGSGTITNNGTTYAISARITNAQMTIATSIYIGIYYEQYRYYTDGPDYWGQKVFDKFNGWIYKISLS